MEKDKVKAWYDEFTDIFYMLFKEGPATKSSKPTQTFTSNSMKKAE